jgi:hypothetical protein
MKRSAIQVSAPAGDERQATWPKSHSSRAFSWIALRSIQATACYPTGEKETQTPLTE